MKVQYGEEVANHSDPESCGAHREVCVEALTVETGRPAIEPRNDQFGMPTLLSEGNADRAHAFQARSEPRGLRIVELQAKQETIDIRSGEASRKV